MSKKTQSKPMKEILTRLQEFEYIKMVVFAEEVILRVNFNILEECSTFKLNDECYRIRLKVGQSVTVWYHFIRKDFRWKKLYNMRNYESLT